MDFDGLPLEIWVRVFYWATFSPVRQHSAHAPSIPLFDALTHKRTHSLYASALSVKLALALVSKRFRTLSREFLLEDIRIRHGAGALAGQLESSRSSPDSLGLGRHVKRIVLPRANVDDAGHSNHWADRDTQRIILCCPNVLELSRYHDLFVKPSYLQRRQHDQQLSEPLEDPSGIFTPQFDPSLPSIRRIDWDNGIPPSMRRTVGAVPSAVWTSQTLQSFSLSGDNYFWNAADLQSWGGSTVSLPALHTLRVNSLYAFGVPGVSTYTLHVPRLRRVILDRAKALHRLVECVLAPPANPRAGASVEHVEIGAPYWRCLHSDYISSLIRHCPNVKTLHYPLFFARVLRWRRIGISDGRREGGAPETMMFPSLTRVGWHGMSNTELWVQPSESFSRQQSQQIRSNSVSSSNATSGSGSGSGGVVWTHLMRHLEALIGPGPTTRTPAIEEIALHGKHWVRLLRDTRFHSALDLAAQMSVRFVAPTRDEDVEGQGEEIARVLEEVSFEYRTDTLFDFLQSL